MDCLSHGVEADLYVQHDLDMMVEAMTIDLEHAEKALVDMFTAMDVAPSEQPGVIGKITEVTHEASLAKISRSAKGWDEDDVPLYDSSLDYVGAYV